VECHIYGDTIPVGEVLGKLACKFLALPSIQFGWQGKFKLPGGPRVLTLLCFLGSIP
jgi:hypothetical protein